MRRSRRGVLELPREAVVCGMDRTAVVVRLLTHDAEKGLLMLPWFLTNESDAEYDQRLGLGEVWDVVVENLLGTLEETSQVKGGPH